MAKMEWTTAGLVLSAVVVLGGFGQEARILSPSWGEVVTEASFPVEVSVKGLGGSAGRRSRFWVSVSSSVGGRPGRVHWPQFPVVTEWSKGRADLAFVPPFPTGEGALLVLRVDERTHERFQLWREAGGASGLPRSDERIVAVSLFRVRD